MNIILFDGVCNLCNWTVSFIIRKDKKNLFRFSAIQSEAGNKLLKQYHIHEEANKTLIYLREKECLKQSTAVLYILKDIGRGWKLLYPLIYLPQKIRDAIYLFISRNRYKIFGKKNKCMVPRPDIKNRFITGSI